MAVPGPYFPDQRPSECGHYYPDVLRLRDERKLDGTLVRIMDCSFCGQYTLPLDERHLSPELVRTLRKDGRDIAIREADIATIRKKCFEEMRSTRGQTSLPTLRSLIETAIQRGADAVELEYVPEGLEVTYFRGSTGIGEIIGDRESNTVILNDLVSQAKLDHKSRGRFTTIHGGNKYELRAEQYESFGERAFRLTFRKLK